MRRWGWGIALASCVASTMAWSCGSSNDTGTDTSVDGGGDAGRSDGARSDGSSTFDGSATTCVPGAEAGACTFAITGDLTTDGGCAVVVFALTSSTDQLQIIANGAGKVGAFIQCTAEHPLDPATFKDDQCISQVATYLADGGVNQVWQALLTGGGSAHETISCGVPPSGFASASLSSDDGGSVMMQAAF